MKMIVVVGCNYEIGIVNEFFWCCFIDLKLFKRFIKNVIVVMGCKMMESFKCFFLECYNFVLMCFYGFVLNGFYFVGVDDVL